MAYEPTIFPFTNPFPPLSPLDKYHPFLQHFPLFAVRCHQYCPAMLWDVVLGLAREEGKEESMCSCMRMLLDVTGECVLFVGEK